MSGFLLDTSVVSLFAPDKPPLSNEVLAVLRDQDESMFLPVIALAEIEQGICKLRRAGASGRAARLAVWLDDLVRGFSNRVLVVDGRIARAAGALSDQATARGIHPGIADILIAATADVHFLTLLTRNLKHFEPLGVPILDPTAWAP